MPMPSTGLTGLSPAANDLGLGSLLQDQVAGETEEQRKRRIAETQQRQATGPGGSLATFSLFGGGIGGIGR